MKKLIGLVTAVLAACAAIPLLAAASLTDAGGSCLPAGLPATGQPETDGTPQPFGPWDDDQVTNARIIVTVGYRKGIPVRGWIIAVATAMQESRLRNLPHGDRDSVGLFQQRPSQGWGTPAQLLDPAYAAGTFYDKLVAVAGWERMPLTAAAQAVQVSAYPDAYAQWEHDATALLASAGPTPSGLLPGHVGTCLSSCPARSGSSRSRGPDSGCMGGEAVLARATTWLTAWDGGPVPYLSSADSTTWFRGYRRDCSGYASMALGLSGPGLTTGALAARSTPIPKAALIPGDLLINPAPDGAGHVVIFDHWSNEAMTTYVGYEQSGNGGTYHRTIPYPYFGGYEMSPFRFRVS